MNHAVKTGAERQAEREAEKANWIAGAYAGVPCPAGPRQPLPARRRVAANPRHLSNASPPNGHVLVVWTDGRRERRYHFTKGYRWGFA